MRAGVAGFALGIAILQQQAQLPHLWLMWLLAGIGIVFLAVSLYPGLPWQGAMAKSILRLSSGIAFGVFWASAFALYYLSTALPPALEGQNLLVTGAIDSLPKEIGQARQFDFKVEQAEHEGQAVIIPPKISLLWSSGFARGTPDPIPDIQPGARWRLNVCLKRPHGNLNPEGFDYEAWLFKQNIRATGSVRQDKKLDIKNRELDAFVSSPANILNRARSALRDHIRAAVPDGRYTGVISALVIGDQQGIGAADWNIFNRTGISHLVAISGMHITMISGLFAAFVSFLWRHSFFTRRQLPLILPAAKVAAIGGVFMAWNYVLLAGFGLPAQRTLYMIIVVAVALWMGRLTRVSHILFAALGIVLFFDPWAVLAPGFWLSFGAVGIILYISAGRKVIFTAETSRKTRWLHALKTATHLQLAITIGLVPLTLLFFGRISIISPLANAVAIPLLGSIVTPLSLVGSIMPAFIAHFILGMAHFLISVLATFLEWFSALPFAVWNAPVPSLWFFIVAILGTIWMLAPKGWPARWLGLACWFPIAFSQPTHPPGGEVRATALDVGQGSAVLIETKNHRLLYDTGPAYSAENDAGSRVILPYLNARGIHSLDTLVISHADMDHAGGAASILKDPDMPVQAVYSSLEPNHSLALLAKQHRSCLAGQQWEWDGVVFEMLAPTVEAHLAPDGRHKSNAVSCVLKVTAGSQSMLLPGDIGVNEELELLERVPEKLRADILLVPHHGSNSSSSMSFIGTVKPSVAIFQMGYRNRYGHPDGTVSARYDVLGVKRMRTDESGAITISFGKKIEAQAARREGARYWQAR